MKPHYPSTAYTCLLIHGAWHGAWCWHKVLPLLEAHGQKVLAIDLPAHGRNKRHAGEVGLDDYVQEVIRAAQRDENKLILVGHSMAGIVIAQAAERLGPARVAALVYLDAFVPEHGESLFDLVEASLMQRSSSLPPPLIMRNILLSDDQKTNFIHPDKTVELFYHDCPEEDQRYATARMEAEPVAPLATALVLTAEQYGAVPRFFIRCTESRDLDKSFLAKRVPEDHVYSLESGHSPFFSMPDKLTDILLSIHHKVLGMALPAFQTQDPVRVNASFK